MNEMMNTMGQVEFNPPGPGSWLLDASHQDRPYSGYMSAIVTDPFERAFRDASARYGIQLETIRIEVINGFFYTQPKPVGAPEGATSSPPKLVFKVMQRVHPELRRRNRDAGEAFARRLWREDVKTWDETTRPKLETMYRSLREVAPEDLDDDSFCEHLRRAREAFIESWYIHHSMFATCAVPMGDLIASVCAWTGLEPETVVRAVRGSSPASCGDEEFLRAIVRALQRDDDARALVESDASEAEIFAALLERADAVGETTRRWRDEVGYRPVTGFDLVDLTAVEMPEMFVGSLRRALGGLDATENQRRAESGLREIESKIPAQHRQTFAELLAEVHLTHRIRDERVAYCDAWMAGMLRRAMVEAGKRLTVKGRLNHQDHVFDLLPDELDSMLAGGDGPSPREAARRTHRRHSISVEHAPEVLGPPPSAPPPAEWVPGAGRRMADAVGTYTAGMFQESDRPSSKTKIGGYAASCGVATGRARVVLTRQDFAKVERGDILIARCTSPTYNVLLPLLAGVVTDRGGLLCHAAIVAREYGIPGVVGTKDATTLIPDGARVRVDGEAGTVELIE